MLSIQCCTDAFSSWRIKAGPATWTQPAEEFHRSVKKFTQQYHISLWNYKLMMESHTRPTALGILT